MYKLIIPALVLLVFGSSCTNSKTYRYVKISEEQGILGGISKKEDEPRTIKATSDSAAYLEAFQYYAIANKVNKDMREALGSIHTTPIDFKLLNEAGQDISKSVIFQDRDSLERQIISRVNSNRNTIKESLDKSKEKEKAEFSKNVKIDSVKIKNLKTFFRLKKDEFSNQNKIWYEPKSAPKYMNRNGLYCYFQTENDIPSNLRLRFQYYAEDWLFFSRIQFSIDGKAYEYIPSKTETDSGDGGKIWEWCDEKLSISDKELIYALGDAKTAKMKIVGSQYYDEKIISREQIKGIKQTLELYNALGGSY